MKPLGDVRVTDMQLGGRVLYRVTIVGLRTKTDAEAALARLKGGGKNLGELNISGCRN